jgi:hypothetical protein
MFIIKDFDQNGHRAVSFAQEPTSAGKDFMKMAAN